MAHKRKSIGTTAVKRNITGTDMVAVLLGMLGDSREPQLLGMIFRDALGKIPHKDEAYSNLKTAVRSYH
jgi:hypothetical protein